jgi:hypothetical protein
MQMQIRHLPKMGDFRMLPGSVYAQSQLKAEGLTNLAPDIFANVQPLPSAAPAAPAPPAPGLVLPTQAPTFLFPTTTEQPAAEETKKGVDTTTILVVGGLVVVGVIAAVALSK